MLASASVAALAIAVGARHRAEAPDGGLGTSSIAGTVWRGGRPVPGSVEVARAGDGFDDRATDAEARARLSTVGLLREAPVVARTSAAADGRFEARALRPGLYVVRASTDDGARGSTLLGIRAEGEHAEIHLQVAPATHTLRARIVRSDGSPFRGAVAVAPRPAVDASALPRYPDNPYYPDARAYAAVLDVVRVTPDERGAIEVAGLPPGTADLFVVDRFVVGGATRLRQALSVDAEPVPVVELPAPDRGDGPEAARIEREATIRGRVVRATDGGPVEGQVVEAFDEADWSGLRPLARTTTDRHGRYAIPGLPSGDIGIRVRGAAGIARGLSDLDADSARRDRPLDYDPLAVEVLPGREAVVDVVLVPGARIVGLVADAAGAPVAGAVVRASGTPRYAMSSDAMPPPFWEVAEAVTGSDGRYAIEGLLPRLAYRVKARRGAQRAAGLTTTPAGGGDARLDLAFPPSTVVDVRVVDDATGAGVAGVPLVASLAGEPESVTAESPVVWHGRSGEDGLARVGPVNRVALEFEAAGEGWSSVGGRAVFEPSVGSSSPWTLRVGWDPGRGPDAAYISKRVLEPRAQEAAGAHALRVRVVGPDGTPVPDARLEWVRRKQGSRGGELGTSSVTDGVASVARESGGESIDVRVDAARAADGTPLPLGWAAAGPFTADVADVRVVLPPEHVVSGRVVDDSGRGVRGFAVRALVPESHDRRFSRNHLAPTAARTDAEGDFRIGGLQAEPLWLVVIAPNRWCDVLPIAVTAGTSPPVEVRLRPLVAATVTVVGPDGRPARSASVSATPPGLLDRDVPSMNSDVPSTNRDVPSTTWRAHAPSERTAEDGTARLEGLDPTVRYTLVVVPKDAKDGESTRIDGWLAHDTEVRLLGR